MRFLSGWRRRAGLLGAAGRVAGPPTSTNGASSFHLRWGDIGECAEVSVTLQVVEPPRVDRLYFWALQADFSDGQHRRAGGAHLGLQWHPAHPGCRAVNWGGYGAHGSELTGTTSTLPSATANQNTRDLWWSAGVPYRLTIGLAPPEAQPADGPRTWRGTVTDLHTGERTVVRDLYVPGDRIVGAVMWSEVFANCDDPTVEVHWSEPTGVALAGGSVRPRAMTVSYQSHGDGGCANTNTTLLDDRETPTFVQRTAVTRVTPVSAVLPVAPPA